MAHFLVMLGDLLDAFQHEGTDPDAEIGGHHVHQAEASDHFEAMNVELRRREGRSMFERIIKEECFTYPRVHEDEVHLHEGENHLENWIHALEDLVAGRRGRHLEEGAEFQTVVDHCTEAESCEGRIRSFSSYFKIISISIPSPMAPILRKKLPWLWSFCEVFRFLSARVATPASTSAAS